MAQDASSRALRTLFNLGAVGDRTDGQLLERFATERGEAAELAFAALVERHGPTVRRVCRSILADGHAADDAFQATFLVLARRARRLWVRDSLGPWLHQVALRTARCARSAEARRRRWERAAASRRPEALAERLHPAEAEDLGGALHEEIGRLPERLRGPVILCELQGQGLEAAARALGVPVGTIKSRLSRGRDRLRARLLKRGLTPNAAAAGALTRIPAELAESLVESVSRAAASGATVEGPAAALAKEVLRMMGLMKLAQMAAVAMAVTGAVTGLAAFGAGRLTGPADPAGEPAPGAITAAVAQEKKEGARPKDETVKTGPYRSYTYQPGLVEAVETSDVFSQVAPTATLLQKKAEGSAVKKGEVVAELDAATLRDALDTQRISVASAKAQLENAEKTLEVAQIALKEYEEGTVPADRAALRREIESSEATIREAGELRERVRKALERVRRMLEQKGDAATPADIAAEIDLEERAFAIGREADREARAIEATKERLTRLERVEFPKTIRTLKAEIEKAKSDALSKQQTYELEKQKEEKLRERIRACRLVAPIDGLVLWANPRRGGDAPAAPLLIEPRATIRERQKVFTVYNLEGPWQVNVQVPAEQIAEVKLGMKLPITFANWRETIWSRGTVRVVTPPPEPNSADDPFPGASTAIVTLDGPRPKRLRPGDRASIGITPSEHEDISVPPGALLRYRDGTYRAAIRKADDSVEWREVQPVDFNLDRVRVLGLLEGERVILEPLSLLSEDERRDKVDPEGFGRSRTLH